MNFDFSALLVLLTLLSGGIWAIDAWYFAGRRRTQQRRQAAPAEEVNEPLLVEYARSFFPIFFVVLVLRAFIVEPFRIPSGSMMPTLLIGDFILVNKYDYGIRLPVINTKIIANGKPKRGDIVVFRYPENPKIPFIKRIIGVPGDHVAYYNKTVYINNQPAKQIDKGIYTMHGAGLAIRSLSWRHESLGDVKHDILVDPRPSSGTVEVIVPEGQYFVLGDNRDNSKDSRYWGFVPDENLIGRAFMIWMNWDASSFWNLASWDVQWDRLGTVIK